MTLTIDVPPSVQERLAARARAAGLDVQTFVQRLLQAEALAPTLDQRLAPIRDAFAKSGVTDDELADRYEAEKHAAREAGRGAEFAE